MLYKKSGFVMRKIVPSNEEYVYENKIIISQTDLEGNITFVNRKFCEVSGYSRDEIIGNPFSLITHPQMPKNIFDKMWENIKSGRAWNGLLKNLRKDGKFYWVEIEILPIYDNNNNMIGYISVSHAPSRKEIQENDELYQKMLHTQE